MDVSKSRSLRASGQKKSERRKLLKDNARLSRISLSQKSRKRMVSPWKVEPRFGCLAWSISFALFGASVALIVTQAVNILYGPPKIVMTQSQEFVDLPDIELCTTPGHEVRFAYYDVEMGKDMMKVWTNVANPGNPEKIPVVLKEFLGEGRYKNSSTWGPCVTFQTSVLHFHPTMTFNAVWILFSLSFEEWFSMEAVKKRNWVGPVLWSFKVAASETYLRSYKFMGTLGYIQTSGRNEPRMHKTEFSIEKHRVIYADGSRQEEWKSWNSYPLVLAEKPRQHKFSAELGDSEYVSNITNPESDRLSSVMFVIRVPTTNGIRPTITQRQYVPLREQLVLLFPSIGGLFTVASCIFHCLFPRKYPKWHFTRTLELQTLIGNVSDSPHRPSSSDEAREIELSSVSFNDTAGV